MKIICLSVVIVILNCFISSSFYDIQFESIEGMTINTSAYQGKKCIITVVSVNPASENLLRYLDSVQRSNTNIQVIAVPTDDFNGNIQMQGLNNIKNNKAILMTTPLKVTKASAMLQHPLFSWLTKNSKNEHFNIDVRGEGQLFMVSEKGTLYAVLPQGTPEKYIARAINQIVAN